MQDKEKIYHEQQNTECDYIKKAITINQMVYTDVELKLERQRMSTCIKNGDVTGTLEVLFSEFARRERK